MKGKIIYWGWVVSIACMVSGLSTMQWAMETGEPGMLLGAGLLIVFVVFSRLLCNNRDLVDAEHKRFEKWLDTILK